MNVQEQLLNERIDPHLTDAALTRLASEALDADVQARRGRILTGGCWNRVISVRVAGAAVASNAGAVDTERAATAPTERGAANEGARELVFKISPRDHDAGLKREYAVLEYFAEHTRMPVPTPYLLAEEGDPIPGTALVMSKIPGAVLHSAYATLSPQDRQRIDRQIADHVLDLHESTVDGFGRVELAPEERYRRWSDFWLPRFDSAMAEARESGHIEASFFHRVDAVRPRFEKWLSEVTTATVCHYDIWSGNVMVARGAEGATVSGFIDIPGYAADYARELSFMLMFGMADEALLRAYADRHGLDEGFALRVNMYNLKMQTKHITMYPSEYYYRQGAEACLRYLEEKKNGNS